MADNLRNSCEYTSLLSQLEIQSSSIKVNLSNYEKRLKVIRATEKQSQIDNLESFANLAREKYRYDRPRTNTKRSQLK